VPRIETPVDRHQADADSQREFQRSARETDIGTHDRHRSLHVLTITPFYPRARDGASGCFVAEPLTNLIGLGMRSTVFAVEALYRQKPEKSRSAPEAQWFRYPSLPGGLGLASAGFGLYLRLRGAVGALHKRNPIDLIHAHGALPCGHAAHLLSRRLKVPYVVSVHGLDAFSDLQVGGRAGASCARVSKRVYAGARRVIGISQHVCDAVRQGMDGGVALSAVYNGADTDVFQPAEDAGPQSLLTVGNLIPVKGHAIVVKALAAVLPEFPGLRWEVIGDGPELNRVCELAATLGVVESILFRGRVGRREVAEAYGRCTVFVLPSRYEGLGCVYLEAMASGKVAIGCTGQGIEEVIRHGDDGWLVPPDGLAELIDGLRILLRDGARRKRIGAMARDTILQSFTLQHQAERLLNVYRECLV